MSSAPRIATVFGGSGFVGRYIVRRLAQQGWRVRVAVRRPNEALFVRTYGTVGQVEPILANIRDKASTRAAIKGADVVVNCVGILVESGRQQFDAVHVEGAGRIARIAAQEGVARLVHVSALGADPESDSEYARSKARGEEAVRAAFPDAVILRPSVIFGPEDRFFNRFGLMAMLSPVIPVVGARTRFQPVYVDDVAAAAVMGAEGSAAPGVYELGGSETRTFRDLVEMMLRMIRRRRLVLSWPFWIARINAWFLDMAQAVSLGLFTNNILTRDQVRQLRHDNVVSGAFPGLEDLGIEPTVMEGILESYLYVYRPHGQYEAIRESADKLRHV